MFNHQTLWISQYLVRMDRRRKFRSKRNKKEIWSASKTISRITSKHIFQAYQTTINMNSRLKSSSSSSLTVIHNHHSHSRDINCIAYPWINPCSRLKCLLYYLLLILIKSHHNSCMHRNNSTKTKEHLIQNQEKDHHHLATELLQKLKFSLRNSNKRTNK